MWFELPSEIRLYLIRYAGGAHRAALARALVRVVLMGQRVPDVAADCGVCAKTLRRRAPKMVADLHADAKAAGYSMMSSLRNAADAADKARRAELFE